MALELNRRAPTPVTIRAATPADASANARIQVETWRAAYRGILPDAHLDRLSVEKRTAAWEKIIGEKRGFTFVAEVDGVVAGWVSGGACREAGESGEAELYAIYLDAAYWRSGLGRRLMAEAEGELARILPAATRISLWVLALNAPARRFYETLGYAPGPLSKTELIGGEPFLELRYEKSISA